MANLAQLLPLAGLVNTMVSKYYEPKSQLGCPLFLPKSKFTSFELNSISLKINTTHKVFAHVYFNAS